MTSVLRRLREASARLLDVQWAACLPFSILNPKLVPMTTMGSWPETRFEAVGRISNGKSCRKRSPHLASILCGTSNLELTIMPGSDQERGRPEPQVTGACCRSSAKINSIPIALHPPRMLTSEDIRPYD